MTGKAKLSTAAVAFLALSWGSYAGAVTIARERVVPASELARDIEIRGIRVHDGTVTGTVVNRSEQPLRDVRLVIRHLWLWDDEFRPPSMGDPSRSEYYTLPEEIPPRGEVAFTYRSTALPPDPRGGRFETLVRVADLVAVEPGLPAAPPSPTAGAGVQRPSE